MSSRSQCRAAADPGAAVAVYSRNFLSASMTFVYRQLLGVADEFRPLVLTGRLINRDRYPYPRVHVCPAGPVERVAGAVLRRTTGHVPAMFRRRREFFRRVMVENGVHLVHAHFGPSGIDMLPLARTLGIPLLVTFHGGDASRLLRYRPYVEKLQELLRYAHVIAVSQTIVDRLALLGADPSRTAVHYIGAPVEDFRFVHRKPLAAKVADGDTLRFLQVANFVEKKGHRYSLQAFRGFSEKYPHCELVLAGDGALRRDIEQLSSRLNIADKVRFAGVVSKSEVIALMNDADAFLHHSVTASDGSQEGIPTALMEAMATGLVVFSTFHAGIPELISDGRSGYLVAERDVAAYTDKMIGSLSRSSGIPEAAAATIHRHFNLRTQNEKLKTIYRDLLGEPVRTGSGQAKACSPGVRAERT